MPAILKKYSVEITQRQAGEFRRKFSEACKQHGVSRAAVICQPVVTWGPFTLSPARIECAVITMALFKKISKLIASNRDAETVAKMRHSHKQKAP